MIYCRYINLWWSKMFQYRVFYVLCAPFRNDIFTFHTESLCQKADVPSEERSSKINSTNVFNVSLYTSDLKSTWDVRFKCLINIEQLPPYATIKFLSGISLFNKHSHDLKENIEIKFKSYIVPSGVQYYSGLNVKRPISQRAEHVEEQNFNSVLIL